MEVKLPIKIHNRFDIEVKDIITGEVVQRGQAENIVLNNLFNSTAFMSYSDTRFTGLYLIYGRGTGTLSPARTKLFDRIRSVETVAVEVIANQVPLPSYATRKITIRPEEDVGEIITEVGLGKDDGSEIFTHALIKDSEGNQIVLGPKTNTQEITIYRTVYFQPNFEEGVSIYRVHSRNGLIAGATMNGESRIQSSSYQQLLVNGSMSNVTTRFGSISDGVMTPGSIRLPTDIGNGKIKTLALGHSGTLSQPLNSCSIQIDVETLAQNNSSIWSGWEFEQTPIGIGDGETTVFPLVWDEARTDKNYSVYVDGTLKSSGVTFKADSITFDIAPASQSVITASYWVDYIPKDDSHVVDVQLVLNFSEGS